MTDGIVSKALQVNTILSTMPRPANEGHWRLSSDEASLTPDLILDAMIFNLTHIREVIETKFTTSVKDRQELEEMKAELACVSRLLRRVLPEVKR